MGFSCRLCRAEISPQDVDAQRMIAKCRACNTLFDAYSGPEGTKLPPSVPRSPRPREAGDAIPEEVIFEPGQRPTPAGYRLAPGGAGSPLRITLPLSRTARREGCGCGMFVVVAGTLAILIVHGDLRGFPAVAGSVGVALFSYMLTVTVVNTISVTADENTLRIASGPLPLLPSKQVATSALAQLFVVARTVRTARGTRNQYDLTALLRDGTRLALLSSESGEDMLFVEKMLERRLGIEDRAMQ